MFAKSEDLRRTLFEIDNLLQTAHVTSADNCLERDEIEFLERSRRSIVVLLEARQTQNSHNVVSLQAWRDGSLVTPQFTATDDAAMARASRPQRGAPRFRSVAPPSFDVSRQTTGERPAPQVTANHSEERQLHDRGGADRFSSGDVGLLIQTKRTK